MLATAKKKSSHDNNVGCMIDYIFYYILEVENSRRTCRSLSAMHK